MTTVGNLVFENVTIGLADAELPETRNGQPTGRMVPRKLLIIQDPATGITAEVRIEPAAWDNVLAVLNGRKLVVATHLPPLNGSAPGG